MYRGKYARRKCTPAKTRSFHQLALILAMMLLVGSMVGSTLAWLIVDTDPVINTFTYGDISLKLEETKTDEKGKPVDEDGDGNPDKTAKGNEYEMLPGEEYLKDPIVTVLAGNEACWLFVKLDEQGGVAITNADGSATTYDFDDYLNYTIAEGWTQLYEDGYFGIEGHETEGVYFRYVDENTDDAATDYEVLMDNKISVLPSVDKDKLNALDNNGQDTAAATYPSLSVTAYAVQYSGFEVEVREGDTATDEQVNTAVQKAWQAVKAQSTSDQP